MKKLVLPLFLLGITLFSCKEDDLTACTEEFKTVSIKVTGADLDKFFTIRTAKLDTITYDSALFDNFYPVLDDSYHSKLKNDQDNFMFIGIVADTIAVQENIIIGADACHVFKISGTSEVEIKKK